MKKRLSCGSGEVAKCVRAPAAQTWESEFYMHVTTAKSGHLDL